MNQKTTFKIVIAFVVILALVLPSSAMFANVGKIVNTSSDSMDIQLFDNSISVMETVDWWSMYRHDLENTGHSTSSAPDINNVLWSYTAGDQIERSSPAVVDGMVFFGSNDYNVYCLDESDGSLIWSYTTGGNVVSSPAVVDGKVYFGSHDNNVYCLNKLDGSLIWSYTTGADIRSSPAVVDGKVYVGSNDYNIYCLNATDGLLVWNYTADYCVFSSPAVVDGKVFIAGSRYIYCLNAMNGSLIWSYSTGGMADISGSLTVINERVFICVTLGGGVLYCLNALDGSLIWSYVTSEGTGIGQTSPAVANEKVFFGCTDAGEGKNIYCLNALDGSLIWKYYIAGGGICTSPSVADGKVYVGCRDYNVYCLNASDGSFVWSRDLSHRPASIAIANGRVFVGSADHNLYCFGLYSGHDVRIESIATSTSPFDIITPEITVQNCGIYSETDVPVNLQITKTGTGNVEYDETVTIDIDSEKNLIVTFPDWTPDDIGASISVQYRITACTQLTTDEKPANNCETKKIGLYPDGIDWWPMDRHDLNNTGYSTSTAPEGDLLWTYSDKNGARFKFSSSVVADGKVYVGSVLDYNLYCLDAYDGSLIWKFAPFHDIRTAPAVADGKVYFSSRDRNLYCLNATDGSLIWIYNHGAALNTAAPTIVDGKIYIGAQCIDGTDGSLIWKYEHPNNLYVSRSSPAVAYGKVYIGSIYGDIFCLNATDGSLIWNYTTMGRIEFSSPAVAYGKVYIGSWDHNLYCLDATNGSLIWSYTTKYRVISSLAVAYGKVFIGSWDVYCLDAINGSLIWNYTNANHRFTWSSPVVADGNVYIVNPHGDIYCLDISDGSPIWEYSIYPYNNIYMSDPAIADGRLYVSASSGYEHPRIWCFGSQSPNQPPYRPSNPDPPNHATNVDIDADLSWTGGDPDGNPVTYDVYFGTTSPPPKVVNNQSSTTYDPDLDYETQYYWYIVAWDNHGASADGPIWDFTTEEEDTTPPVTTCDLKGEIEGGVYIIDVTVTLTATDDMSGVAETFYRLNDGEWQEYSAFVVSEDGAHTISFYSIDNAGNIEDIKTETFTIQHPCSIEIEVSGGIGVNVVITNTGDTDVTDLEWSINITGGMLGLIDKEVNGIIPLLTAGDSATVKSGIFFGLGSISITVTAGCAEETVDGKQLIIFTKVG